MSGNVGEWVQDEWHDNYEGAPADGRAWSQGKRFSVRVFRGGSWGLKPETLRATFRNGCNAGIRIDSIGFRLARDLD
jgi:formylglycine-generating enzyme required for sulfatase activity